MNNNCEMIRDLLPLYLDGVCSDASRGAVEAHLEECEDCSALLERMRKNELETAITAEKTEVISSQAAFFKRKAAKAGAIISGIFMIPILVCMIVNLASGAGLTWFFIVLTAIMTAASLIVVPLMMPENKALWTLGTFTASLLLLLAVCCIYTGGRWFFVAAMSILFGLAVIFLPFVANAKPVAAVLGKNKGLAVVGADTILYLLMLTAIAVYNRSAGTLGKATFISLPFILLAWIFFAFIRYVPLDGLTKAGILTAICGAMIFFANTVIGLFAGYSAPLPALKLNDWSYANFDGNVKWVILLSTLVIGAILAVAGILVRGKKSAQ